MTSWASRTVEGQYLGHAPSTPGGHLVWVHDDAVGPKVLLTNTVYPVSPSSVGAAKPKRRLASKTSAEFVMKPVSASSVWRQLPGSQTLLSSEMARFVPGGEWLSGDEGTDGLLEEGTGGLLWNFSSLDECGEYDALSNVSSALSQQRACGGVTCMVSKAAHSEVRGLCDMTEELLRRPLGKEGIEFARCFDVLQSWFDEAREGSKIMGGWEGEVTIGLQDLSMESEVFPRLTSWLTHVVDKGSDNFTWTTVTLTRNCRGQGFAAGWEDPGCEVWVVTLGSFQGGGLCLEGEDGEGSVVRMWDDGSVGVGEVLPLRNSPVKFAGLRRYGLEPWMGGDLWMLRAFTKRKGMMSPIEGVACSIERAGPNVEEVAWDVDFPHLVLNEQERSNAVSLHEAARYLKRRLWLSMSCGEADLDGLVRTS